MEPVKRRNTVQKKIVLETLKRMGSHMSAGEIWENVHEEHPSIGRATVFRVLAEEASDGRLRRIPTGDEDIFDVTLCEHAHVICEMCGKVSDVWLDGQITDYVKDSSGYALHSEEILFKGLCPDCLKESKNNFI